MAFRSTPGASWGAGRRGNRRCWSCRRSWSRCPICQRPRRSPCAAPSSRRRAPRYGRPVPSPAPKRWPPPARRKSRWRVCRLRARRGTLPARGGWGCPRASSCTRGDNRPRDCVRRWWKGGWAASPLRWQGRYGGPHGPPGFQSSSLTSVASAGLSAAVESDHHRHQEQKDARYVGIRRIKLHGRYTAADGVPYLPAQLGRDREEYAPETEYGQRTHHNDHSIIRFGTPDGCGNGAELVPISGIHRGLEGYRGICRTRNRAPAYARLAQKRSIRGFGFWSGSGSGNRTHTHLAVKRLLRPLCIPVSPSRHRGRSEEHTSELQSRQYLVCRLLLE